MVSTNARAYDPREPTDRTAPLRQAWGTRWHAVAPGRGDASAGPSRAERERYGAMSAHDAAVAFAMVTRSGFARRRARPDAGPAINR
jgi:hypothetical protein